MTLFTTLLYHSPLNERMLRISENKCISYPMLRNAFFKRSHWLKMAILFAYDSVSHRFGKLWSSAGVIRLAVPFRRHSWAWLA